jgi:hypothetical protein
MAKKVRGHRANKPNDSFGTINNNNLYRGGYREDVYAEEDKDVEEQQAQPEEEKTEPSFVQGEAEVKHDYKKRYDDLKRHYDEKVQEFKDKEKQLEATLTEATRSQGISLPKTEEELVKFKEEFPDVYDVVETIATMKAGERAQILEQELETIREKEQNTRVQAAYQELINSHPDFNEIRQDEKFLGWLEEQPPSISDGILKNNTDARWASRVVDLYKADVNITPKRTKKKKEDAAVSVGAAKARDLTDSRTEGRMFKASDIAKMKPWEFEKMESEIDSARAEGRIDYNS